MLFLLYSQVWVLSSPSPPLNVAPPPPTPPGGLSPSLFQDLNPMRPPQPCAQPSCLSLTFSLPQLGVGRKEQQPPFPHCNWGGQQPTTSQLRRGNSSPPSPVAAGGEKQLYPAYSRWGAALAPLPIAGGGTQHSPLQLGGSITPFPIAPGGGNSSTPFPTAGGVAAQLGAALPPSPLQLGGDSSTPFPQCTWGAAVAPRSPPPIAAWEGE